MTFSNDARPTAERNRGPNVRRSRIRFDDGRLGVQTECRSANGDWELAGITVTNHPDGTPCRVVYSRHSDLGAMVFSFADLAPSEWTVVEGDR